MHAIRSRADAIGVRQPLSKAPWPSTALRGASLPARASESGLGGGDGGGRGDQCTPAPSPLGEARREQQHTTLEIHSTTIATASSRRQALFAAAATALVAVAAAPRAAEAADDDAPSSSSTATATPTTTTDLEPFLDNDWSISYPRGYVYREDLSVPPQRDPSRPGGPAPARSPLRARFDAPALPSTGAPAALLSVIVRQAQTLKPTLMQVSDISAFGEPEDAAKLLLPRGARVVSAASSQETSPPRETPLGPVEIPPVSYYYYEFIAPGGAERAVVAAAAARGKI